MPETDTKPIGKIDMYRTTLDSTTDGIMVFDLNDRICLTNTRIRELWDIPEAILNETNGEIAREWMAGLIVEPEIFFKDYDKLGEDDKTYHYARLEMKDGRYFDRCWRAQFIDGTFVGRVLTIWDTSKRVQEEQEYIRQNIELKEAYAKSVAIQEELKEEVERRIAAEEKLRHMATHDELTSLPNRRLLIEMMDVIISQSHRNRKYAGVFFIDLDDFKDINDNFGHDAGDHVLVKVAERLKDCIRESDFTARIGGDEFVIVYTELDHSDAVLSSLARHVLDVIMEPISLPQGEIGKIGASIGIASYPTHGKDPEALIKAADHAMYGIKDAGRNHFGIAPDPEKK